MTITRKYIRQCRTLFPVYGNSERTFLNRLKVQIIEHLDLFPDLSEEKKKRTNLRNQLTIYLPNDNLMLSKLMKMRRF